MVPDSDLGGEHFLPGNAVGEFAAQLARGLVHQNVPRLRLGVNKDESVGSDSLRGLGTIFRLGCSRCVPSAGTGGLLLDRRGAGGGGRCRPRATVRRPDAGGPAARRPLRGCGRTGAAMRRISVRGRGGGAPRQSQCTYIGYPGSWLLAPGSWLLAPGSWYVVRQEPALRTWSFLSSAAAVLRVGGQVCMRDRSCPRALVPVVGRRDRVPVSRRDPLSGIRGARGSVRYAPR